MTKGHVARLSESLVDAKIVEKVRSRGDGRVHALDLTPFGESVAQAANLGVFSWELLNDELGEERAHQLASALVALAREPDEW
jgi:DNA-binding MarR family transcriptional regulator